MEKIKKSLVFLLTLCLLIANNYLPTFASQNELLDVQTLIKTDISQLDKKDLKKAQKFVSDLGENEFSNFVGDFVTKSGKEFSLVQKELRLLNVTLTDKSKNKPTAYVSGWDFTPSDMSYGVYSFYRDSSSSVWIQASVTYNETPYKCGSYDIISLEWESQKADYLAYSISEPSYVSTRDLSQRFNGGIITFNVYDRDIYAPFSFYVSARVASKSSYVGQTMHTGSRYIHSFETTSTSSTGQLSVNYSQKDGWAGGFSVGVTNTPTGEQTWQTDQLYDIYLAH